MKLKDVLDVAKGNCQIISNGAPVIDNTGKLTKLRIWRDHPMVSSMLDCEVESISPAIKVTEDSEFIQILDIVLKAPTKSDHKILTFEHELKQY